MLDNIHFAERNNRANGSQASFVQMWMDGGQNSTIENKTTYYLTVGSGYSDFRVGNQSSVNGLKAGPDGPDWWWVSSFKCNAQMWYRVSKCQLDGERMTKCLDLQEGSGAQLDTVVLSRLTDDLNELPMALYLQDDSSFGLPVIAAAVTYSPSSELELQSATRGPRIKDYVNMYGGITYPMANDISNGYYDTAVIPSEDTVSDLVYSVRVPILPLVDFMPYAVWMLSLLVVRLCHFICQRKSDR